MKSYSRHLPWKTYDGVTRIPIISKHGYFEAVIDADMESSARPYSWHIHRVRNLFYAVAIVRENGKQRLVKLHDLVISVPPGKEVDHRDHNGLDCRRSNLRIATRQQNCCNRRSGVKTKSGYRCVTPFRDKWRAYITINRHQYHVGVFDDPKSAALAYNEAAVKHFGEFAVLNEIHA